MSGPDWIYCEVCGESWMEGCEPKCTCAPDDLDRTKCPNCCNCIRNLRDDVERWKQRAEKAEAENAK